MSHRARFTRFRDLRTIFYSALFFWSLYLLYKLTTWDQFEDWSVPLIVMIPLIILLVLRILELLEVQVVQDILPEEEEQSLQDLTAATEEDTDDVDGETAESASEEHGNSEYVVVGSVIALTIAIYLFGFIISLPLFVFLFVLYLDDWKGALVTTVIFSVLVYILFIGILDAFIWPGIFFDIQDYIPI